MTPLNAKYAKCDNPRIVWQQYSDGSKCLQITGDGEDIATASVNIGRLPEGLIAIKDYSENEGILAWLIENKIVSEPIAHRESGYVNIPICKLLVDCKADIE